MTERKVETIKKPNAIEDALGLPSGSTEITVSKPVTESTEIEVYDEKDNSIDKELDHIKDMAHYTFERIQDTIDDIEPKYAARLHEVSAGFLDKMLDAVKTKAKIKIEKDKLTKKAPSKITNTTNNTVISTTSDILEQLRKKDTIEGEFKEVEKDKGKDE
jgi:hypothetical protein